jgi:uncharacterized membrane protein YbaN (DUF454 family)
MKTKQILAAAVGLIGLFMIVNFWGAMPPVVSGVAFVLLSAMQFVK